MNDKLLKKQNPKKAIAIRLHEYQLKDLDRHAAKHGVSRNRFIEFALFEAINALDRKK